MTPSWWPKTSAPSWRMRADVAQPATACSTFGSIGDQPSAAVTIVVRLHAALERAAALVLEALGDDVTAVTSATPIISADAVTAVRPGLRIALSAGEPAGGAAEAAAGRPTTLASARTPRANSRTLTGFDAVAQRGDGRDLRRAPGRDRGGEHRRERADEQRDDDRAGGERQALGGQVHAERGEQRVQAGGERDADADPGGGGQQADQQRLEQHARRAPGGGWRRPSAAARTPSCAGRR